MKPDRFKLSIGSAVMLACFSIPLAVAQNPAADMEAAPQSQVDTPARVSADKLIESGIQPDALESYLLAARELHQGHAVLAERDANRALQQDAGFADAAALAATAALMQQQFARAASEAVQAIHINPADEKAYVILATAQNYRGDYSDAVEALGHVRTQEQQTWQVAYQWARAEAGLQHLAECLEWSNRAALSAPESFAPLHLLRASALLATGDTARAADELEVYLQFPSVNPGQRELLTRELQHLRQQAPSTDVSSSATGN